MSDSGVVSILVNVDDSSLEAALARLEESNSRIDKDVTVVAAKTEQLVEKEGSEIKGMEAAGHRIIRMIPGLREVDRLQRGLGQISAGNVMGLVGLFFVAMRLIKMLNQYFDKIKQQAQEMEAYVREARGFTTHEQYAQWQAQQKEGMRATRNLNR